MNPDATFRERIHGLLSSFPLMISCIRFSAPGVGSSLFRKEQLGPCMTLRFLPKPLPPQLQSGSTPPIMPDNIIARLIPPKETTGSVSSIEKLLLLTPTFILTYFYFAEGVGFEPTCRFYPTIRFRIGAVMTSSVPFLKY